MSSILGCTTRPYADTPLHEACRYIAQAGFTDVALFRTAGITASSTQAQALQVRRVVEDAGLAPSMLLAHADLKSGLSHAVAEYRRLIDNAVALGATWLLDLGQGDRALREDYVAAMRQVVPYAAQGGLQITVKPHGGITTTTADLLSIYQEVDHPAYSICYDPGNIIYYTVGDEMPTDHIAEIAPFVRTGIIKDCVIHKGRPDVLVTPGEGLVDFDAVFSALIQTGFDGPLYLECVAGQGLNEVDANVRRTQPYVRALLSEIEARSS